MGKDYGPVFCLFSVELFVESVAVAPRHQGAADGVQLVAAVFSRKKVDWETKALQAERKPPIARGGIGFDNLYITVFIKLSEQF
jgi:hypothetical protein